MNLLVRQVKRGGNQAEHSGKNECGANGFRGGKAGDKEQSRDGETAAADAGEADRERNDKANEQMGHCERSEKVWMPHSSLRPPQRPERGLLLSAGTAVQGWQPILK